jgi:hypothetical protein
VSTVHLVVIRGYATHQCDASVSSRLQPPNECALNQSPDDNQMPLRIFRRNQAMPSYRVPWFLPDRRHAPADLNRHALVAIQEHGAHLFGQRVASYSSPDWMSDVGELGWERDEKVDFGAVLHGK